MDEGSSGGSSGMEELLPLASRPAWAGFEPLVLVPAPGVSPVVAIQYEPHHAEAMAYFRQVMAKVRGAKCVPTNLAAQE
jgi:hypothetical protein